MLSRKRQGRGTACRRRQRGPLRVCRWQERQGRLDPGKESLQGSKPGEDKSDGGLKVLVVCLVENR